MSPGSPYVVWVPGLRIDPLRLQGTFGRGALVGTLPQELSSLQLTGEPVMVQRKKKPSGARWKRQRRQEKRTLPHRPTQDWELEAPTVANRVLGLDVVTGGSSRTKRPLSPGGTPQDAQSQVKRTKQKQKETPYNS